MSLTNEARELVARLRQHSAAGQSVTGTMAVLSDDQSDAANMIERLLAGSSEPEQMYADEDGWSEWVHPELGYRMTCCDCDLVHHMEFAIVYRGPDDHALNPGEGDKVIVFRAKRAVR